MKYLDICEKIEKEIEILNAFYENYNNRFKISYFFDDYEFELNVSITYRCKTILNLNYSIYDYVCNLNIELLKLRRDIKRIIDGAMEVVKIEYEIDSKNEDIEMGLEEVD